MSERQNELILEIMNKSAQLSKLVSAAISTGLNVSVEIGEHLEIGGEGGVSMPGSPISCVVEVCNTIRPVKPNRYKLRSEGEEIFDFIRRTF